MSIPRALPEDLPSALSNTGEIANWMQEKSLLVFLDYDGTLTPIVSHPEEAVLSEKTRETVRELARWCPVTIVSGRDRKDVQNLVNLDRLIYAGSHGFDITGPSSLGFNSRIGEEFLPTLERAESQLRKHLANNAGIRIERKKYAIAIHYRNADQAATDRAKQLVRQVLGEMRGLKSSGGKEILELRPDIDWDKGAAVLMLTDSLTPENGANLPMYIGDDITDEDAFRAIRTEGVGILVGSHGSDTYAKFRLEHVGEVRQFLTFLINTLRESDIAK